MFWTLTSVGCIIVGMDEASRRDKILAYAENYLEAYASTVDQYHDGARTILSGLNRESEYFPLYGLDIGHTTSLAVFSADSDFSLFFVNEEENTIYADEDASGEAAFNSQWTFQAPENVKLEQIKTRLNLNDASIFKQVRVPGNNVLHLGMDDIITNARNHGSNQANADGQRASGNLPQVLEEVGLETELQRYANRYTELQSADIMPQVRGARFETLWREVLDSYGWNTKKFRIPGEENDFTAIYQGNHILGEVRWFATKMTGSKMRDFLGKLDPRPQTIGLFISYSGFDRGALSVARRAINTKTVVLFTKSEIDKVLLERQDPGELFSKMLRDAYDNVLENQDEHNDSTSSAG